MKYFFRYVRNPSAYIVVSILAGITRMTTTLNGEVIGTSWFLAIIILAVLNTAAIVFSDELLSTSGFSYEGDRYESINLASSVLGGITGLSTTLVAIPHVVNGFAAIYCIVVGLEEFVFLLNVMLVTTAYRLYNMYNNWLARKG